MFDNDVCSVDELKSTIVKNLTKSWKKVRGKNTKLFLFRLIAEVKLLHSLLYSKK